MTRHQVSAAVILHAILVALAAVVIGVLIGTLFANIGWRLFSRSVGFAWPVEMPTLSVALVAVGSVLIATAIATVVALSPLSRPPDRLN
jgi:ABC-type antimicrobial peptide transport system permease subunit